MTISNGSSPIGLIMERYINEATYKSRDFVGSVSNEFGYVKDLYEGQNIVSRFALTKSALKARFNGENRYYNIFGEHNKPTGSYIGNGSSESRTVEIGGVGAVLLVVGSNGYLSFVTASGAFGITGTSTSMTVLKKSECALSNGVLIIASTSNFLNASGETYYYRLL